MSTLSLGYYPGCSGLGTSLEYDLSTRACCERLGIKLTDIPDWTCCGSTPAHTVDHVLSCAISARNLAQAEEVGVTEMITPCPSCLKNLRNATIALEDDFFTARVEALTQRPLKEKHSIKSVLQILVEDIGLDAIKEKVVRPLEGLRVVPYYGCLMQRPAADMKFDDPENPMSMDNLLTALGATVLPFPLKVDCCGASFSIPSRDVVPKLSFRLLQMASELGADCVVVACPLCQMNLDLRQGQINRANNASYNLPVPYFTQLLGYAMGLDDTKLGFSKLALDVRPLLEKIEAEKAVPQEAQSAEKKEAMAKAGGEA